MFSKVMKSLFKAVVVSEMVYVTYVFMFMNQLR